MTSEIALWNSKSVALAADRAGTWGNNQSFNSSEKIYQLAGRQPVGYMTCGAGGFMGIGWARIFGMYREFLGAQIDPRTDKEAKELPVLQSHPQAWDENSGDWYPEESYNAIYRRNEDGTRWLDEKEQPERIMSPSKSPPEWDSLGYVEHFLHFLDTSEYAIKHLTGAKRGVIDWGMVMELARLLKNEDKIPVLKVLQWEHPKRRKRAEELGHSEVSKGMRKYRKGLQEILDREVGNWAEAELKSLSKEQKSEHHGLLISETKVLNEAVGWFFPEEFRLTKKLKTNLRKLAAIFLLRGDRHPSESASVVIAGFGKEEETPSVVHLEFYPKWRGKLKIRRIEGDIKALGEKDSDLGRRYSWRGGRGAETFAQSEMIDALLSGRHPDWDRATEKSIRKNIGKFIDDIAAETKGIASKGDLLKRLRSKAKKQSKSLALALKIDNYDMFKDSRSEVSRYREGSYVVDELYMLSPEDLTMFAGKLVDIESTFQYVRGGLGKSVGGETTVASITKENGFMWINRTDTFDPELNPRAQHNPRLRAQHI